MHVYCFITIHPVDVWFQKKGFEQGVSILDLDGFLYAKWFELPPKNSFDLLKGNSPIANMNAANVRLWRPLDRDFCRHIFGIQYHDVLAVTQKMLPYM